MPAQMDVRNPRLARIVGLSHKNFVYHFAHGQTETGFPFLIMEYMDGTLNPQETSEKSTHFHLQVLKSLAAVGKEMKARGIVHRDIKPDNVFYRKKTIKLADFGLMSDDYEQEKRTATGMSMGTILYMPPEQVVDAKRATWQSDQFAMGATTYHLMTGAYPLAVQDISQLTQIELQRAAIEREKLPSIMQEKDIQKEGIEQILARMLQSVPEKRYPDYQELQEDIARVERGKLPKYASPKLTGTTFRLSDHSNHYAYRRGKILRTAVLATTAAGIGAAAYLGYIDSLINFAIKLSQ
jgi:serine/threonine protein kinase